MSLKFKSIQSHPKMNFVSESGFSSLTTSEKNNGDKIYIIHRDLPVSATNWSESNRLELPASDGWIVTTKTINSVQWKVYVNSLSASIPVVYVPPQVDIAAPGRRFYESTFEGYPAADGWMKYSTRTGIVVWNKYDPSKGITILPSDPSVILDSTAIGTIMMIQEETYSGNIPCRMYVYNGSEFVDILDPNYGGMAPQGSLTVRELIFPANHPEYVYVRTKNSSEGFVFYRFILGSKTFETSGSGNVLYGENNTNITEALNTPGTIDFLFGDPSSWYADRHSEGWTTYEDDRTVFVSSRGSGLSGSGPTNFSPFDMVGWERVPTGSGDKETKDYYPGFSSGYTSKVVLIPPNGSNIAVELANTRTIGVGGNSIVTYTADSDGYNKYLLCRYFLFADMDTSDSYNDPIDLSRNMTWTWNILDAQADRLTFNSLGTTVSGIRVSLDNIPSNELSSKILGPLKRIRIYKPSTT